MSAAPLFARIRRPDPSRGYREVALVAPGVRSVHVAAPGDDTSSDPATTAREWAVLGLSMRHDLMPATVPAATGSRVIPGAMGATEDAL